MIIKYHLINQLSIYFINIMINLLAFLLHTWYSIIANIIKEVNI